ncbi:MAG TPA: DUF2946 family protein [Stellaceae bacterium]
MRGTTAWFVVAALVFPAWLAAPLAMRMEAQLQAAAGAAAGLLLCGGVSGSGPQQSPPDDGNGGGSAPRHDHQHCVLCQGGFAPAILAVAPTARSPDVLSAPPQPAGSAIAAVGGGAASYAPRAPPARDDA